MKKLRSGSYLRPLLCESSVWVGAGVQVLVPFLCITRMRMYSKVVVGRKVPHECQSQYTGNTHKPESSHGVDENHLRRFYCNVTL
eukprot:307545-Amphidinium_carterae.1